MLLYDNDDENGKAPKYEVKEIPAEHIAVSIYNFNDFLRGRSEEETQGYFVWYPELGELVILTFHLGFVDLTHLVYYYTSQITKGTDYCDISMHLWVWGKKRLWSFNARNFLFAVFVIYAYNNICTKFHCIILNINRKITAERKPMLDKKNRLAIFSYKINRSITNFNQFLIHSAKNYSKSISKMYEIAFHIK